jgi:hypothetical protein
VFALVGGMHVVVAPADLEVERGVEYVGDGALRYRSVFEERGAIVPADADERHRPRARFHAQLARDFGPIEEIEPLYLRLPDAQKQSDRR